MMQTDAKPFVKWAGGKGQLLDEIDLRLGRMIRELGLLCVRHNSLVS